MGHEPPDSFEAGTLSTPSIVGLGAGLKFVTARKREEIESFENKLFAYTKMLLRQMTRVKIYLPEAEKGSLLLLGFDGISPSEVAEKLAAYGICTRAGLHCAPMAHRALRTGGDALRISFSAMNTFGEAEAFANTLQAVLK